MPRVAFTFDDGPGPITAALLDSLAAARWPATFFVLGRNVVEAPWCGDPARAEALVVRALREGHVVGNHTWSHRQPDAWPSLADEVARGDEVVRRCRRLAGVDVDAPIAFRLPYGIRLVERTFASETGTINASSLDPRLPVLASLGRTHVHWSSDFADWDAKAGDGEVIAGRIAAHVEAQAALGLDAVLCLHDSGSGNSARGFDRPATLEAVRRVLEIARLRGWRPFTVPVR